MTSNGGPARLLRVYGFWILLVTAVVTAGGYGASGLAPTAYRSAAIVVVEARVRANTTPVQPAMGTEKELARSGLVLGPAARQLGVDPALLAEGLTVSVAPDANVLTFAYDAVDPATAQRRAQALAQAYVDYRNAGGSPSGGRTAADDANTHATLVTSAVEPTAPAARPIWIDLGIGLVLGLLLGIGTALLRDRISDRVRGRTDFEQVAGVTVLATVPRVRRVRGAAAARPVLLRAPGSPAAESYRYLRSRLQPMLGDRPSTVLVASPHEREGRSTTAANLALALALAGRTVVLVDADLRRPRLSTLFGLAGGRGLTSLLRGESTVSETLQDGPVPGLRVLAAGPGTDRAADLLPGPRLAWVLRTLRQQCDVVVLDAAAVLEVADAVTLAAACDHVLLVGDYRRTTRAALARAGAELREVNPYDVTGVLVNAPRTAGGLVPHARGGSPRRTAAYPVDPYEPVDADDPGVDGPAIDAPAPRAALVPVAVPAAGTPASTLYASASAAPTSPAARNPAAPTSPAARNPAAPTSPAARNPAAPTSPAARNPAAPRAWIPGMRGPVKARTNSVDNQPATASAGPAADRGEAERSAPG